MSFGRFHVCVWAYTLKCLYLFQNTPLKSKMNIRTPKFEVILTVHRR